MADDDGTELHRAVPAWVRAWALARGEPEPRPIERRDSFLTVRFQDGLFAAGGPSTAFVGVDPDPAAILTAASEARPHHHMILAFVPAPTDDADVPYERAGYRRSELEYLMARALDPLPELPRPASGVAITRIATAGGAAPVLAAQSALGLKRTQHWQCRLAQVGRPTHHHWLATADGQTAGWGIVVLTDDALAAPFGIYTLPDFRGRGLGSDLMIRALQAAAAAGATWSLLSSTAAGHGLYRRLGYRDLAEMRFYEPAA